MNFIQAQRAADRNGRMPTGLRTDGAQSIIPTRGRLRIDRTSGRVSSPVGQE